FSAIAMATESADTTIITGFIGISVEYFASFSNSFRHRRIPTSQQRVGDLIGASVPDQYPVSAPAPESVLESNVQGGGMSMQLAKFVKFREEKFGGVLFETRSEKVFTLNAVASAVVREITAGSDEAQIVMKMKERFEDREEAIERDALEFIAELRKKGLVQD
ncbi:MAG: PqqD family protein, partial [Betaproteobacteria bacterium]